MLARRGALALVSGAVLIAAVAITVSGAPAATAANSTSVEAEAMSVSPSYAGGTVSDQNASDGAAHALRSPATASKSVAVAASASVVVRARGQRTCGSPPTMTVTVDGKNASTTQVSATAWTDYTKSIMIAAGSHTIGVRALVHR